MRGLFTSDSFQLDAGEVISGASKSAQILRIKSGNAWVTIEGIGHDYWLSAGDALRVATGSLVVVEAQRDGLRAQTAIETVPPHSFIRRGLQALFARIKGGVAQRRDKRNGTDECSAQAQCCALG